MIFSSITVHILESLYTLLHLNFFKSLSLPGTPCVYNTICWVLTVARNQYIFIREWKSKEYLTFIKHLINKDNVLNRSKGTGRQHLLNWWNKLWSILEKVMFCLNETIQLEYVLKYIECFHNWQLEKLLFSLHIFLNIIIYAFMIGYYSFNSSRNIITFATSRSISFIIVLCNTTKISKHFQNYDNRTSQVNLSQGKPNILLKTLNFF